MHARWFLFFVLVLHETASNLVFLLSFHSLNSSSSLIELDSFTGGLIHAVVRIVFTSFIQVHMIDVNEADAGRAVPVTDCKHVIYMARPMPKFVHQMCQQVWFEYTSQ